MSQLELLERKARLWHIHQAVSSILEMTTDKTIADYENDRLLRLAVERQMIQTNLPLLLNEVSTVLAAPA
jgi:hypothetical protein